MLKHVKAPYHPYHPYRPCLAISSILLGMSQPPKNLRSPFFWPVRRLSRAACVEGLVRRALLGPLQQGWPGAGVFWKWGTLPVVHHFPYQDDCHFYGHIWSYMYISLYQFYQYIMVYQTKPHGAEVLISRSYRGGCSINVRSSARNPQ